MNPCDISWPQPGKSWELGQEEVHVWASTLNRPAAVLERLLDTLSSVERDRAARYCFPRDRGRFVASRGFMRGVLGSYLQVDPSAVAIQIGVNGKPELASSGDSGGLHFNLAHSESLSLLAVTRLGPVGVDIEKICPLNGEESIAARFFTQRENEALRQLENGRRTPAFFNLWTRKEAWLKATGEGISDGLNRVEVSFEEGEPARLISIDGDEAAVSRWVLVGLEPAPGFAGALAVAGGAAVLKQWQWPG